MNDRLPNPREHNVLWWWELDAKNCKGKVYLYDSLQGWIYVRHPITPEHMDAMINAWNSMVLNPNEVKSWPRTTIDHFY